MLSNCCWLRIWDLSTSQTTVLSLSTEHVYVIFSFELNATYSSCIGLVLGLETATIVVYKNIIMSGKNEHVF